MCELAKRVNVQGFVLDDEDTVVEHETACQRTKIRQQEDCCEPQRSRRTGCAAKAAFASFAVALASAAAFLCC